MSLLCQHYITGLSRDDVLRLLDRMAELTSDTPDEWAPLASAHLARLRLQFGDHRWRDIVPTTVVEDVPGELWQAIGTYYVGEAACMSGHYELARRQAATCLKADDKRVLRPMLVSAAHLLQFEIDYWCGAWDGLEQAFRQHLEQRVVPLATEREQAVLGGLMLSRLGPTENVKRTLDSVLAVATAAGKLEVIASAAGPRARIEDARENHTMFLGMDALTDAIDSGMVMPCMYRPLAPLTRILLAAAETRRARDIVDIMSHHAPCLEAPLAAGALSHARGHIAAEECRWSESIAHYLAAADQHDATLMPYEAAQAREDAARAMLTTKYPAAPETLRAAIQSYGDLGAQWDVDRASSVARQHEVSVPARHRAGPRGYGKELSPREREVARLAAGGSTNREIAEALFLSINTVNRHLSATLRKLGLKSRRQLPGHLDHLTPAPDEK